MATFNKIVCDRCYREIGYREAHGENRELSFMVTSKLDSEWKHVDLCDACYSKLLAFINSEDSAHDE
jgi:hypothetical protein